MSCRTSSAAIVSGRNSGVCESNVFRNSVIQVVANHQHVKVLINCVDGVWHGWVCRSWQDVRETSNLDDVRCVTAACAFGVECVHYTTCDSIQSIFNTASLVQCVSVNCNHNIIVVSNCQAGIDSCRCGTPVFVNLHAGSTCYNLLSQRAVCRAVALTIHEDVHWELFGSLQHLRDVPWARSTGSSVCTICRACTATSHCGDTGEQSCVNLLSADPVNVSIDTTSGNDQAFSHHRMDRRLRLRRLWGRWQQRF